MTFFDIGAFRFQSDGFGDCLSKRKPPVCRPHLVRVQLIDLPRLQGWRSCRESRGGAWWAMWRALFGKVSGDVTDLAHGRLTAGGQASVLAGGPAAASGWPMR